MVLDLGMMEALVQLVQQYGVLAVIIGMVIEEVFVPIPSPVVPMAAGFFLVEATTIPAAMVEIFFLIALPASIASVLSSYFVYGVAFYGGKPVIEKWGGYLELSWEELTRLERHFVDGNERYYIALFRAIPVVPLSLISGSAGLFRVDWRTYGIWSFIGMMPRNFILAYIGWAVKDDFMKLASMIDTASTAVLVAAVLLFGGWVAYRNISNVWKIIIARV